jgi:cytochrome c-type biogenesis protein CcmF
MLPEIAHYCLIIALCFAGLLSFVPLCGAYLHDTRMMRSAKPLAAIVFAFVACAFFMLIALFLQDDFSVKVVMQTSNLSLPILYKVTALWGGHEGSLLLWVFILAVWMLAVSLFSKDIPDDMIAKVLAIMGMVTVGFLLFSLLTSNPFERVLPNIPIDGRDLNPLLQDIGMAIHPPMLYIGYVGFSVAFAFAIAALLSGEFDTAWVRWTRPWTTAAWSFLTLGIALGSWWAYYELGWGGWWFWDPVENASFMPWLVGTALIHSLAVTEQRGLFKSWTILLAIFAFSLSLLGTFLVRSGVLTSVHSFAADPGRGLFILGFLAIVIGGSLTLFAFKAPSVRSNGSFSFFSREMFLLFNNVLLVVAALTVLVGTLFPLLADAFEMGKYSVGPPYFNTVFVPIMLLLICFMGAGPLLRWKQTRRDQLLIIVKIVMPLALLLTLLFVVVYNAGWKVPTIISFALVAWLLASMVVSLWQKTRNASNKIEGLKRLTLSFYGMQIAHIGLVVTALGIGIVSTYNVERDIRIEAGETVELEQYKVIFQGHENKQGPNFRAQVGHFSLYDNERKIADMYPEKRQYLSQMGNVMTEAAIDASLSRDVFIALGEPLDNGAWAARLQYKPFIRLIWLGAILMTLGGFLALADKRYR